MLGIVYEKSMHARIGTVLVWSNGVLYKRILASYLNENKQYYNSSFQPI